MLICEEVKR